MDEGAAEAFDAIAASLDTPMAIVTAAVDRERAGCLLGFEAQSSIEPKRLTVWLSKANHTYRVALRATHFAVHFLTAEHLDLAEHFGTLTGDDVNKFARWPATSEAGGAPLITGMPHWMVLRKVALLDEGGDHVCVVGELEAAATAGPFAPLRLSQVSHLRPGHQAEERHGPPTERAPS
jgi:flavin reductase (DIM6/NTAB) family NADH-FMN oxidoreductase RutF